jgi:DNA-binding beta-propeller fold protein YncE
MSNRPARLHVVSAVLTAALATSVIDAARLRPMPPVYVDSKGSRIEQPEGVGCTDSGLLVVADTGGGRLLRLQLTETTITPVTEIAVAQLVRPIRVRVDSAGGILALDGRQRRIVRISPSGEFEGFLEPQGVSGSVVPRSFDVGAGDEVFILDVFSSRVLVIDLAGSVRREIALPEEYGFFSDIAVDSGGRLYLIDSVERRVYSAAPDDTVVVPWGDSLSGHADFPTAIAVDEGNRVYVADQNGGSILTLGSDGSYLGPQARMGWREGFLRYPAGLCVAGGHLFVADRGNNRVQVFAILD